MNFPAMRDRDLDPVIFLENDAPERIVGVSVPNGARVVALEFDHLTGLKKTLQSYGGERLIFHGPSKLRARTGKSIGHGTQVGVKASSLRVDLGHYQCGCYCT
jgi:hypothetical protein